MKYGVLPLIEEQIYEVACPLVRFHSIMMAQQERTVEPLCLARAATTNETKLDFSFFFPAAVPIQRIEIVKRQDVIHRAK